MQKILASLMIMFVLVACTPDPVTMIAESKQGVVAIIAEQKPDPTGIQGKSVTGIGTGYFVGENIIITNFHVAGDKKSIKVGFSTADAFYDAEFLYGDKESDVAVIKLKDWDKFKKDNPDYRLLHFSQTLPKDGETVYVIGHPWGLFYSVSKGIVSLSMRKSPNTIPTWWIQTDAHVYNGNSGGPMLNEIGEVVGMNSMMMAQEGGSYGFALPASLIQKITMDLEKYKEVRWATLGIMMKPPGVTIESIDPNGPAAKSELKPGDKIVGIKVNKHSYPVDSSLDLISSLSILDYTTMIHLLVERDNTIIDVMFKPGYKLTSQYPKE
jgi:serine protease Do